MIGYVDIVLYLAFECIQDAVVFRGMQKVLENNPLSLVLSLLYKCIFFTSELALDKPLTYCATTNILQFYVLDINVQ